MALPTKPEAYKYLFTDDMRFIQKAVIKHPGENKFLIVKRCKSEYIRPGTWDLPGGNLLYGEIADEGLRREIFEETGLPIVDLKPFYVVTKHDTSKPMYYLLLGWQCRATSDHVVLSHEHSEYAWVTKKEFVALDPAYTYREKRDLDTNSTNFLRDIVYHLNND